MPTGCRSSLRRAARRAEAPRTPAVRSPIRSCTCHPSRCSSRPRRRTRPPRRPPDRRSRRRHRCMPRRGRGSPSRSARGTPACTGRLPPCRTRSCTRRRVPRRRVTVHRRRRRSRRPRRCIPPPAACTAATRTRASSFGAAAGRHARRARGAAAGEAVVTGGVAVVVRAVARLRRRRAVLGNATIRRADPCSWRPAGGGTRKNGARCAAERLVGLPVAIVVRAVAFLRRRFAGPAAGRAGPVAEGAARRTARSGVLALAVLDAELHASVPAAGRQAGTRAGVAVVGVAVVARLHPDPYDAVPAAGRQAGTRAGVAAVGVAVVALFHPDAQDPVPAPRQAAVRTALVTVERIAVVALLPGLGLQHAVPASQLGRRIRGPAGAVEADLSRPAGDARRQTETAEVYGHVDRAARRERRPDTPLHSHAAVRSQARHAKLHPPRRLAGRGGRTEEGQLGRAGAQDDGLDRLRVVVGSTVSRAHVDPDRGELRRNVEIRRHGQADGRGRRRGATREDLQGKAAQDGPGAPTDRAAARLPVSPLRRPIPMRPHGPAGTPSGSRTQSRRAHLEVGRLTDRSNRHGGESTIRGDGGQRAGATEPTPGCLGRVAGRKPRTSSKGQAPAQGWGASNAVRRTAPQDRRLPEAPSARES